MAKEPAMTVLSKGKSVLQIPGESLVKMANAYFDYQKTCVVESRRRAQIEAWRQVTVKALDGHFSQIKQWSTDQHDQKMQVLNVLNNALQSLGPQIPPEYLVTLTQQMVELIKVDHLPNRIQALKGQTPQTKSLEQHISDDEYLDI